MHSVKALSRSCSTSNAHAALAACGPDRPPRQRCPLTRTIGNLWQTASRVHSSSIPAVDGNAAVTSGGHNQAQLVQVLVQSVGLRDLDATQLANKHLDGIPPASLSEGVEALRARYKASNIQQLALQAPQALRLDVPSWITFLETWASHDIIWEVLRYHHAALASTDVFTAGRAILFLKRLGPWSDSDVARRVLPCHAALLAREEGALESVAARLRALELGEERVQQLLYEFPGLLYESFGEEQLALAERVFERNRNKYSMSGSYEI